jgi:amino acid adenylation domain-containing protein
MDTIVKDITKLSLEQKQALLAELLRKKANKKRSFPLSFAQQRLWFLDQLVPNNSFYNIPVALRLKGRLDVESLQRTFDEIVRRHESLRTRFGSVEGRPVQIISSEQEMNLKLVDLSSFSSAEREQKALRLASEEANRPFNLAEGPLLRVTLLKIEEQEHIAVLVMHHIVSDGWSMGVLVNEIAALYEAFSTGSPSPLPELKIQYADFACWQREWLQGETLANQLSYWKKQLSDITPFELPTDRPRPSMKSYKGASQTITLSKELSEALKKLSRQEGATLFMTLLAAFQVLLYRYTGQTDISTGSVIANRNRAEIENLIGFFVNTLVMRADLSGDPDFKELLGQVKEVTLGAYAHQDIPFEKIVEELQPERDTSRAPLFQVMFQLQNTPAGELELPGLTLSPLDIDIVTAKFDLSFSVMETEHGLTCLMIYNTDLFNADTISRMLGHYESLLKSIIAEPEQKISRLSLLTEAERRQLLVECNSRLLDYPKDSCIHRLFEEQAERNPDAIAVVFERQQLTYRELNERANRLAHHLIEMGAGPEVLVGICLERSIEMVMGLLAILKSGAAYVPLDPSYPKERLAFIIEDARLPLLVTKQKLIDSLPSHQARVVCIDSEKDAISARVVENPKIEITPDNLAYVIYTSGSTGRPKGVLINHYNVVRLFESTRPWFNFDKNDVWTLFHSYAFDFSVWEIWGALLYGGRLVVVPYWTSRSPEAFYDLLCCEQVTVLNQTPSAFRQLIRAEESLGATDLNHKDTKGTKNSIVLNQPLLNLRLVIFGGEALELRSLEPWFERHGDQRPRLVNMYGITETTVHVTYRPLTISDLAAAKGSVIGTAIPDLKIHILDQHLQPVPVGVAGEIHVGGMGLGRGYLNRSELTEERFIADPFSNEPNARLYKSGDLARYLADGDIEYIGRIDNQVKIRGFRIELGEIEAALAEHSGLRDSAVIMREDRPGDRQLVAYLITKREPAPSISELRSFLKERLPEYMIPSVFVLLDHLPLTNNGKLDRRALPSPEQQRREIEKTHVAPTSQLEKLLVEIWQEVLEIENIGIHDNFFELGGDSIKGAILINKLQERFKEIIHVVVIFDNPNIADLAKYLIKEYPIAIARVDESELHIENRTKIERVDQVKVTEIRQLIKPLPLHKPDKSKNPPAIFVLAPPRSGTTLLRVMLAGHPGLFAPPELELLSFNTLEERKAAFAGRNSFWLEGTIRAIMEIRNYDAEPARKLMQEYEEEKLSTKQFYGLMQEWIGEKILVDKTPSYALDIEMLKKAERDFEKPLYLHLLRHPYGMIRSFEEAKLDQIFFRHAHPFSRRELAELIWLISHQNILEFLEDVPRERQHRVRFEELVSEPKPVLGGICRFLDLEYHPDMAQPYKDKKKKMTDGIHPESKMLGDVKFHTHKGVDRSVADRWAADYDEDFLGDITWKMAETLGYQQNRIEKKTTLSSSKTLVSIEPIRREPGAGIPLSFAQQRLWFIDLLVPNNSFYNIPIALRLTGSLDIDALLRTLNEIVRRHESLRTRFGSFEGSPVQIISDRGELSMNIIDLCSLSKEVREKEALRLTEEEVYKPFNLSEGPLLRMTLLRLNEQEHIAVLVMHHIVSDGWSMGVLVREIATLYDAFSNGNPSPLPELKIQYGDFAFWQREWLQGETLEKQLSYWREQLVDITPLEIPTDRPRPAVNSYRGASKPIILSQELSDAIKRLSRQEGTTLFMTLLAAFEVLLQHYSNQDDIAIGTTIANRNRAEIENLIGFFVNTLVMRVNLSGNPSFKELLDQVRGVALGAYAHQDIPFEKIVEELKPERDTSRAPLVQIIFQMQNTRMQQLELSGLTLGSIDVEVGGAKFDLSLSMSESEQGLIGSMIYNTDLFDDETIERMLGHYKRLLESIIVDPEEKVSRLLLFSEAERNELLTKWTRRNFSPPQQRRPSLGRAYVAPRNRLEKLLAGIWQEVLGVENIGIHDDFFELGGDSIKGAIFINKLQERFKEIIHVVVIFDNPTIADMAKYLSRDYPDAVARVFREDPKPRMNPTRLSSLVELQRGSKTPFFSVHPIGGNVHCYMELARLLGPEQPFYGLQSPELSYGGEPHRSVEGMAAHYIEQIRLVQPQGPYQLGGWSFGGVVAFEMARQLQTEGEIVELLALFDSYSQISTRDESLIAARFAMDLAGPLVENFSYDGFDRLNLDQQLALILEQAKAERILPSETEASQIRRLFEIFKNNTLAMQRYKPGYYSGRITLFKAGDRPTDIAAPELGWSNYSAEPINVQTIPGNHYTILTRPNVGVLAERLKRYIV